MCYRIGDPVSKGSPKIGDPLTTHHSLLTFINQL